MTVSTLGAKKTQLVCVIMSALVVLASLVLFFPQQAGAWTSSSFPPRCGVPAALNGWDYKSKVREVWPAFNPETSQKAMIIVEVWGANPSYPQTNFIMGDELKFTMNDDQEYLVQRTISSTSTPNWPFRDKFGSGNDSVYFMNFTFSSNPSDTATYQTLGNFSGTPASTMTNSTVLSSYSSTYAAGSVKCIASAINVKYDALYTLPRYDALAVDNGLGATDQCDQSWSNPADKIGCYLRKSITAVGDAISDVAKDFANGIATVFSWAFIPDEQEVEDLVGATKTFFEEKLGFILFPFEFANNLFSVFSDPPSDWCSTTSCMITAGTVFGSGSFQVNVLAIKQASEAAWSLLTLLARIGLVLALVAGIHRKFEEVTQK